MPQTPNPGSLKFVIVMAGLLTDTVSNAFPSPVKEQWQ